MSNDRLVGLVLRLLILATIVAIGVIGVMAVRATLIDKPEGPRTAAERTLMDAEDAVKTDPTSVQARIALSFAYTQVGRYSEAAEQASVAAKLDKRNAGAYYALGVAQKGLGQSGQAIAALKKSVSLKTGNNELYQQAYYEMGELYTSMNKPKEAVEAYRNALYNGPEATYVVIALAKAYEKVGDRQSAVTEYKAVLDYDPANQEAKDALVRLGVKIKK